MKMDRRTFYEGACRKVKHDELLKTKSNPNSELLFFKTDRKDEKFKHETL